MITKSIMAILFLFRPGKLGDKAEVNSCNGWVQHRGAFREPRVYAFIFQAQLAKGNVSVSIFDAGKREVLRLSQGIPTGEIAVAEGEKYYVRWEFEDATGKCELRW